MIELLILHELKQGIRTMYGISKAIQKEFLMLTLPSFGTIKPALIRLEREGCLKTQKNMSKGGRPSTYYSISSKGNDYLKEKLLSPISENPVQFLTEARIRVACAGILSANELKSLTTLLKQKCEIIIANTKNILEFQSTDFLPRMVYDNIICECKNFISLLEGIERAGNN